MRKRQMDKGDASTVGMFQPSAAQIAKSQKRRAKKPPLVKRHKKQIWFCAIGECDLKKFKGRSGLDGPMRDFVTAAYAAVTGEAPKFVFSGWNHELTPSQRAVVEGGN